ncbi:MAG TPA: MBOAT family O-acyltransferase [Anaerolineaceae bacterium]
MNWEQILWLTGGAVFLRLFGRGRLRLWGLLVASVFVVFWLQPPLPIRGLDFWMPMATIGLACVGWALTAPRPLLSWRHDLWAGTVILLETGVLLGVQSLLPVGAILPSDPPQIMLVLIGCLLGATLIYIILRADNYRPILIWSALAILILCLVVLKNPGLLQMTASGLRMLVGQSATLAQSTDIRWLGFSYLAFRLIHTLRDRQNGRLMNASLAEYLIYMVFFPALAAGPIDRMERFLKDLRSETGMGAADFIEGGKRIILGMVMKFVLADSLALAALNPENALQVRSPGWAWGMLYAYSLQIYFDFAGYTHIAIGIGRILAIHLPENFRQPYLKPNLTQFWNNWHISLTQWFRAYFFNPFTRWLRTRKPAIPATLILLLSQSATMVLIGLWHGISWNFLIWGLWHGLGLFLQNRWSDWSKNIAPAWIQKKNVAVLLKAASVGLTFHYVALGWLWFVLPEPAGALRFFLCLLGRG